MSKRVILVLPLIVVLSITVFGESYFTGNLTGSQETPPNASTATGFGRVTLNAAETQITASFYYSGLGSNVTAGHIHTGAVGVAGPITFNMNPTTGVTSGSVVAATFAVTAQQVADLKSGNMYFNVHTVNFPAGEIRGQLIVDSPYVAYMDNNQENPATASTARGSGVVSINAAGTQALVTMNWSGLTTAAISGHVHSARSGVNGPIICNLSPGATTSGSVVDFLCTFTAPQITAIRQGQMYLNVHSTTFPGGEIRGQIQRRRSTVLDFDGDSRTDNVIARNNVGTNGIEWWIQGSAGSTSAFVWGASAEFNTGRIVACDFDGDGKDDPAVWRSGATPNAFFLILNSADSTMRFEQFGTTSDDPRVVYDFDGDGRCDPAVYRSGASTWFYLGSSNNAARNITYVPWGGSSFASAGDYDGDGRGDFLLQRTAQWWLLFSSGGFRVDTFGAGSMFQTPGDFDGDGKTDLAGTLGETQGVSGTAWYYLSSLNPTQSPYVTRQFFGTTARTRAQGDYDGDGKSDYAIWLTGTHEFWALNSSTNAFTVSTWGATGDFAVAGYNNR